MMRRLSMPVWLVLGLMGCVFGSAQAARPESLEVRDQGVSRGLLTITIMDDGSAYIAPDHLAALLKGAWAVKGDRGTLTVGTRVAEFTRGHTRTTVDGQAVTLDLPPQVNGREWLVSRDFLGKGLPRLAPSVSLALPTAARKPATKVVQAAVPLEELRYRSYPSFTRIVIETGGTAGLRGGHRRRRGARAAARPGPLPLPGRGDRRRAREGGPPRAGGRRRRAAHRARGRRRRGEGTPRFRTHSGSCSTSTARGRAAAPGEPAARHDAAAPADRAGRRPRRPRLRARSARPASRRRKWSWTSPGAWREWSRSGLGIKVVLSRDTDVFVPLRDRTNFANKQRADLFVSIHANAHPRSVSEGRRDVLPVLRGVRQRGATGRGDRERRGPAREPRPRAQQGRRAQEHPLGPRPVRVPAGVELHGRDGPGLDDASRSAWSIAASSRPGSTCWAGRPCRPSSSRSAFSRIRKEEKKLGHAGVPRGGRRGRSSPGSPSTSAATISACAPRRPCPAKGGPTR